MKLLHNLKKIYKKNINNIALNYDNKKVTYHQFCTEVLNVSSFLKKKNAKKICIVEGKNEEHYYYVFIFASLLAGITYIPVSSNTPKLRIKDLLQISKPDLLISTRQYNFLKKLKIAFINPNKKIKIENDKKFKIVNTNKDAYIIFTSGSTGKPKGVRISRKALDNYVEWLRKKIFNDKVIKCSQHPRIGFDLSVADIFGTICSGGTLFPIKKNIDRVFLSKFINKNQLTHWISVPSLVDLIFLNTVNKRDKINSLKKVFFCGEILKKNHLKRIFKYNKKIKVINCYGPTEATVSCTYQNFNYKNYKNLCKPTASIGVPIKGTYFTLRRINSDKNIGELIISGNQVSSGYLGDISQNKIKFIHRKKKRSFITGDICKKFNNKYYFLNRLDRQTKILGNRIEMGEIDNRIEEITKLNSYTLKVNDKLVTFIDGDFSKYNLKNKLINYFHSNIIPNKILKIKKFPRNKNEKIDETKLLAKINL